jgi:phage-related protein
MGHSLRLLENGLPPELDVRPMLSIGAGVFELKDSDETTWYRTVYLSQIEDRIYVLECFTKNTRKTERHDLDTRKARLAQALQQLRKEPKRC